MSAIAARTRDPGSASTVAPSLEVLHVRSTDRFGGPERLILDQATKAGPGVASTVVSFLAADRPNLLLDAAEGLGVRVIRIPQRGSYDRRVVGRLREAMAAARADVVVGHDYRSNRLLRWATRGEPRLRAAIVHGYTAEDRKVRFFEAMDRRLLRGFDLVVGVSQAICDLLVASGVPPDRVRLCENGIEPDRVAREAAAGRERLRTEWAVSPQERVILALGRLSPEKGHAVLLEAYAQAATPCTRLVLVGDGPCEADLRATAARLGTHGVTFAGWRGDPCSCLGAADLFVQPSQREGLPLAVLEAMAARVPVIATRVGAVPEVLDGGRCGRLVEPGDVSGLSRALSEALADPAGTAERAIAAHQRVASRYNSNRQARVLSDLWVEHRARGPVVR